MEIIEQAFRPVKRISTSHVKVRCVQLQIIIHRLWQVLKRVEERRKVGKRMIHV